MHDGTQDWVLGEKKDASTLLFSKHTSVWQTPSWQNKVKQTSRRWKAHVCCVALKSPRRLFHYTFGQFNLVYGLSWFEVFIGNWPRKVSDYPYRFHAFCFSGTLVHIFCEKQILQVTVRWRACVLSVSVRWLDGKPEALTWKQVDETASRRRHALMSQILLTVCRNQRGSVLI